MFGLARARGGREVSWGQSCSQTGGSRDVAPQAAPKVPGWNTATPAAATTAGATLRLRPGSRPRGPGSQGTRGSALGLHRPHHQQPLPVPQPLGRCSKGQLWHLRADWIKDLVWNPILLQSTHLSWEALGFHPWHSDGPGAQSPPQEQPPLQQREHKDLCRANTQSPNTPSQKEHIPS